MNQALFITPVKTSESQIMQPTRKTLAGYLLSSRIRTKK